LEEQLTVSVTQYSILKAEYLKHVNRDVASVEQRRRLLEAELESLQGHRHSLSGLQISLA
jgi:hypothetical protein